MSGPSDQVSSVSPVEVKTIGKRAGRLRRRCQGLSGHHRRAPSARRWATRFRECRAARQSSRGSERERCHRHCHGPRGCGAATPNEHADIVRPTQPPNHWWCQGRGRPRSGTSDCGCQRNDMDHRRRRIENALRRHNHSRMPKAGFAAFGRAEIEVDDITRVRRRAMSPRRRGAATGDRNRFVPGEARAQPTSRSCPPSSSSRRRGASDHHESLSRSSRLCCLCKSAYVESNRPIRRRTRPMTRRRSRGAAPHVAPGCGESVAHRFGVSGRVSSDWDHADMTYPDEPITRATYSVDDVAQLLGIARTTAYESIRRGEIPFASVRATHRRPA